MFILGLTVPALFIPVAAFLVLRQLAQRKRQQ